MGVADLAMVDAILMRKEGGSALVLNFVLVTISLDCATFFAKSTTLESVITV